ncbi:Orn/Lys/Arg decarboxylase N-terminal domain-containing protein [Pseudomonas aeruginosa]|nr:Orn/Lys/Arg decarboxylase N-terminal domain-containing protein [Pseudomonas aeruginosa]
MSRNNPSRHSILVTSNINAANDANRLSELCRQLEIRGYRLFQAPSRKVALDFLGNAAHPAGILLLVAEPTGENEAAQLAALDELRQVAPSIPLFLLFRQLRIEQLSSQLLDEVQGCFNLAAGPARFIAERIDSDLREWRAPAGPRRLRDYAPPVPRTPVSARYNGRARLDLAPAKQWRIGSGSTAERLATPLNDLSTAYRKTSAGAPAAHAGDIAEAFRRALWEAPPRGSPGRMAIRGSSRYCGATRGLASRPAGRRRRSAGTGSPRHSTAVLGWTRCASP